MPAVDINRTPGWGTTVDSEYRRIWWNVTNKRIIPQGMVLDGTKARDPDNTGYTNILRAGTILGKITSGGKLAPSIIGQTDAAYNGTGTSITVTAGVALEIARRIGATGSILLVGPPVAGGLVRTKKVAFTAVGATTLTIAAQGPAPADNVQTITLNAALTAGTVSYGITDLTDGVMKWVTATWATDWATTMAAWNVLADAVFGTAAVVMTGTATAQIFTFSGGIYAKRINPEVNVDVTGATGPATYTRAMVGGHSEAFVTKSLILPTDGSENFLGIIAKGDGMTVTDRLGTGVDVLVPELAVGGDLLSEQILNYPADAALKVWLKNKLKAVGPWIFSDDFIASA